MIDTRELMIVPNTFDNVALVEQNVQLQANFSALLITVTVVAVISVIAFGYYVEKQNQKKYIVVE